MPSEIEYINGMAIMAIKPGTASPISLKSMFKTVASIKKPTIISAGAVANAGIARNTGANSKEAKKSIATVTAERPVRPPAITPEELSTKVVTVEVPSTAPADVATESASSAPLILGRRPCLSSILALDATCLQHRLKYPVCQTNLQT